ncbi:UPF0488 protein C8orf33 homolog [Pholidichthys leucotaenia]
MKKQRLFIDNEANANRSTPVETQKPLWTRSDNSFRFNFCADGSSAPEDQSSSSDRTESTAVKVTFTEQDSAFAFNFKIPPEIPAENMETSEPADASSLGESHCTEEENASLLKEAKSSPGQSVETKTKKKKKKSEKKKPSVTEALQTPAEGNDGGEEKLSPEEQLNRELDWCIEQLELGMRSQRGTPKQKEEASRALKTLRSSKAPLAKKRQVMRAMTGDYRKQMKEEREKQFRLVQSETSSALVRVVSESPKKSVFYRRAEDKTQMMATETNPQQPEAQGGDKEATSAFVFLQSKEEFCFNFF